MKKVSLAVLMTVIIMMFVASSVFASSIVYTASNGGLGDYGTATFNVLSSSQLTVTLQNTSNITSIANELDGLSFTFSSTPTGVSLESGTTIGAELDCTSGTCVSTSAGTSPYWVISGTAPVLMAAGGSGFHPYGIVDSSIYTNIGDDGLVNAQHNPLLLGPVTFTIDFTGLTMTPNITSADFYFGTTPDIVDGTPGTSVPEPTTLLLLGLGLVGVAGIRRKFNK